MTDRPIARRTRWQLLAALVAVVLVGVAVQWAHVSAPDAPLDLIAAGATQPGDPALEAVTCERTLPDAPSTAREIADIEPVGRIASSEVLACPDAFDGHVVVYVGEVVGDVLQRRDGAWALVNDDAYALEVGPLSGHREFEGGNTGLSVWLPDDQATLVDEPGNADRRGDVVRVRGVIRRADPADGGGLTLRAVETRVVVEAQYLERPVNRAQLWVALGLSLAAVAAVVVERRAARRD
jgi:hypothetical protein